VIYTAIGIDARRREEGVTGGYGVTLRIAVANAQYDRARLNLTVEPEGLAIEVDAEALERAVRAMRICAMSDDLAAGKS